MSGGKTLKKNPRRSDTIPKRKSGKAQIEAPMREARSSPPAHRGARVIRTDALRFMLILQEPRGGQEHKQDTKDDPNINAPCILSAFIGALMVGMLLGEPDLIIMLFGAVGGVMVGAGFFFVVTGVIRLLFRQRETMI